MLVHLKGDLIGLRLNVKISDNSIMGHNTRNTDRIRGTKMERCS